MIQRRGHLMQGYQRREGREFICPLSSYFIRRDAAGQDRAPALCADWVFAE